MFIFLNEFLFGKFSINYSFLFSKSDKMQEKHQTEATECDIHRYPLLNLSDFHTSDDQIKIASTDKGHSQYIKNII